MENGTKTSVRTMATGSDSPGLGYTGLTRGAVPITAFQRNGSSPGNREGPVGDVQLHQGGGPGSNWGSYRFCEGVISDETLSSWYFLIAKRSRA